MIVNSVSFPRKKTISALISAVAIWLFACCEKFEPRRVAFVTTDSVTQVGYTTLQAWGSIVDEGKGISVYGHCWSTEMNPSVGDIISLFTGLEDDLNFSTSISDLEPGTRYYIRTYAETADSITYGESLTFTTLEAGVPVLGTHEVTAVTSNTAVCGGDVTDNGGFAVTDRGVCWNQNGNPTPEDDMATHNGTGDGIFISEIEGLVEGQEYYVRAYAVNSKGTGYGEIRVFGTTSKATVNTEGISNLLPTSVVCGGNVVSDGDATITERGVCWGTSPEPTHDNSVQTSTGQTGTFSVTIEDLQPAKRYYARAYAININGITYGEQVEFTTPFEDIRDGRIYGVVQIGEQYWMAENLDYGQRIDISVGQSENSTIEKYCYDNDPANCEIYGGLYTWAEMMQYSGMESAQGVCPSGWHLPSDSEWKELEMSLGISETEADLFDWRGTDQGAQLKATGTSLWLSPNNATNSTQFSALPAGYSIEDSNDFGGIGDYTTFWTTTKYAEDAIIYRLLQHEETRIRRTTGDIVNGTPVRCVKN